MIYANLRRRKARTLLTIVGISIGVATLFALLSISAGIELTLEREIGGLGAHIILLPEGCPHMLTLALVQGVDTMEYIPEEMLPPIKGENNVRLAVPVVVGKAMMNNNLVSIYGTTEEINELKQWGIEEFNGAVVGSDVAGDLNLTQGQTIYLKGYDELDIKIIKILDETGGRDDTFIFVPLNFSQKLFELGGNLSAILVTTEDVGKAAETRYALGRLGDIQAVPPSEVFDILMDLFASIKANLLMITGIAIVAGILTTVNTMTMAAYERRKDIGLLRAIGATKKDVFKLFMLESLFLSVIAGIFGVLTGYVFMNLFPMAGILGIEYSPYFSPQYVLICLITACGVGSISGIYPAMSAAKTTPINALREL